MNKIFRIAFLGLFLIVGLNLSLDAAEDKAPNIILIIADDLGYGDLGVYGGRDIRTPRLDRLAEEGIRLSQGYVSAPYCGPSRAGLMTGRYQQRHGFYNNPSYRPGNLSMGLDTEEETMADVMKRAGYRTAAFGKWHLGAAPVFHPNNRGFDEFCGFLGGGHHYFPMQYAQILEGYSNSQKIPHSPEIYQYATPLECSGVDLAPQEGYLTDILTDYAMDFVDRYTSRPFFIYLAYNAPHTPLQATEEDIALYSHIEDKNRRVFAAMMTNLDRNVGRLLDKLGEHGIRDNTLVVFISDNGGQELWGADNGPLRGRKGQTWEGGVRVPFILSWNDGLPVNQVVDIPFSTLDLLPTFAAVAGILPSGKPLDGKNVLPWLKGDAKGHPHERLFWENEEWCGIQEGDWKMVHVADGDPWNLSDLEKDIGEEKNLAAGHEKRVQSLESVFMDWYKNLAPKRWLDPGQE
jgi:arylsulfatase A-like enzyme